MKSPRRSDARHPRPRRQAAAFAVALGVALGTHAGALMWLPDLLRAADTTSGGPSAVTTASAASTRPWQVRLASLAPAGASAPITPPVDTAHDLPPAASAAPARISAVSASEAPASATPGPDLSGYWRAEDLDRAPQPYSAPATDTLEGVTASGLPIRLRLYIGADGVVAGVQTLAAAAQDLALVRQLGTMFRGTRYVPGRLHGQDVPAYADVLIAPAPADIAPRP